MHHWSPDTEARAARYHVQAPGARPRPGPRHPLAGGPGRVWSVAMGAVGSTSGAFHVLPPGKHSFASLTAYA